MALDEGGRDEATLPPTVPQPLRQPNGRFAVTMAKLLELVSRDTRMGRASGDR